MTFVLFELKRHEFHAGIGHCARLQPRIVLELSKSHAKSRLSETKVRLLKVRETKGDWMSIWWTIEVDFREDCEFFWQKKNKNYSWNTVNSWIREIIWILEKILRISKNNLWLGFTRNTQKMSAWTLESGKIFVSELKFNTKEIYSKTTNTIETWTVARWEQTNVSSSRGSLKTYVNNTT